MGINMKVLDHETLLRLNESSIRVGRRQNIGPEQMPDRPRRQYIVNFRFEHRRGDEPDIRMSVILQPGVLTSWLDVSTEEYETLPEVELSELEWEAAVCVGTPRWTA